MPYEVCVCQRIFAGEKYDGRLPCAHRKGEVCAQDGGCQLLVHLSQRGIPGLRAHAHGARICARAREDALRRTGREFPRRGSGGVQRQFLLYHPAAALLRGGTRRNGRRALLFDGRFCLFSSGRPRAEDRKVLHAAHLCRSLRDEGRALCVLSRGGALPFGGNCAREWAGAS